MAVTKLKVGNKFFKARSPSRKLSNVGINRAIQDMVERGDRLSTGAKCLIVFFKRGAKVTAAQRCEGRKLPKRRNAGQCRNRKHLFTKCKRGAQA